MSRRKRELTPEEEIHHRRKKRLKQILKYYQQWQVLVEEENLLFITVEGEEYFFYEILDGLNTLPPRQREAVELLYLNDLREEDAAKMMGFVKWSTPAQIYAQQGLERLLKYQDLEMRRAS